MLEPRAANRPHPHGQAVLQAYGFEVAMARGIDRAALPCAGVERMRLAAELERGGQLREQQRGGARRGLGGEQQAVAAVGELAAQRSRGEASDSIGDAPFEPCGDVRVAELAASKAQLVHVSLLARAGSTRRGAPTRRILGRFGAPRQPRVAR
jgi:hypothetical protein